MSHPDDSTIERFVMEGLADDAAFVAHVGSCEECSRKLERQAEIELAMFEVRRAAALAPVAEAQPAAERSPRRTSRAWQVIGPALAFAAAAVLVVWVGRHGGATSVASLASGDPTGAAVAVVSCPDGPAQLGCIAEAHRSGGRLEYPRGTPLAALGSEPGLTLAIEPSFSDGALLEVDAFLAKAPGDVKSCAERAIVSEDAPIRTGHIGINVTILPGGGVEHSQTVLVIENGEKERTLSDLDAPMATTDTLVARCMRQATDAFPFRGGGQPVRISFVVKYVWRE